jgi:hypothetical protein
MPGHNTPPPSVIPRLWEFDRLLAPPSRLDGHRKEPPMSTVAARFAGSFMTLALAATPLAAQDLFRSPIIEVGALCENVAAGDLDGDGNDDLVLLSSIDVAVFARDDGELLLVHRILRLTPSGRERLRRKVGELLDALGQLDDERGEPLALTLHLAPTRSG